MRNPPFAFQCGWRYVWSAEDTVITYERLTSNEMSGGSGYNVTGGLDINTGVFTVPQAFSGVWAVTYSMRSRQLSEEANQAWLFLNGEEIKESFDIFPPALVFSTIRTFLFPFLSRLQGRH